VPLLIHLLRRRTGQRVEFPAARYLARAEEEQSRQLRMHNILLMLVRVAVVLLIALAASGPIGRVVGVGHSPTAVAVVLDNSASSSVIVEGRPLFHLMRDAATDLVSRATPADRFWLVDAAGDATGGSIAVVGAAVRELEPSAGSGSLSLALARALSLVEGSGMDERRIAIVTDGQRFEWRDVNGIDAGEAAVTLLSPVVVLPANRTIMSVEVRPPRWTPLGEIVARVSSDDSVSYRINLSERALARGTAAAGDEIVVRATPQERGWLAGSVEIQPDELRADDVRHFAVWTGTPPTVAVHPAAGAFVEKAVDALVQAGRLARGTGIRIAPAEHVENLPALILAPTEPVTLGSANRALERMGVPWRFAEVVEGAASVRPVPGGIWADEGVSVSTRYRMEPRGGGDTDTLALVGGEPWMVAGVGYVILASPVLPQAGNLALRASFLPLLAELLTQRLSGEGGSVINAFPGAVVPRPLWADAIEEVGGNSRALEGLTITAPRTAGVYPLSRAGRTSGALVVNPPAGEFDLARLSGSELRARFTSDKATVLADAERWVRQTFESAGRRPMVVPFLIAALCAVLLESLLTRDRGVRRNA
jgi:hypothetical protein